MGGMNQAPYLSVVLPCRNQADHIRTILLGYFAALDEIGQPYELVIVPNACTDATVAIVRAMALLASFSSAITPDEPLMT